MPSFTLVFENTSPFLTYSGNWRPGTSSDDKSADLYSQSSFSVTQAANASMSFAFYGNSVGIYGAKRGGHGPYQVQVDDKQFPPGNGNSPIDTFNQTLFSASLDMGSHTITLTNGAANFLDVDYVSWKTSVGKDDEALIVNTIQDADGAFTYSPESSWTQTPDMVATFSGGSGHAASSPGAVAQLSFKVGDAVALYGPTGPNSAASYSVQVDNKAANTFSAFKQSGYRPQQLLYYGGNLGSGNHILKIKLDSNSATNQALGIDYAQIYTAPSLGGSLTVAQAGAVSNALPTGVIVALALVSTLAALSLASLIFLFVLYRRGWFKKDSGAMPTHFRSDSETMSSGSLGPSGILGAGYVISQNVASQSIGSNSTSPRGIAYPDISSSKTRQRMDASRQAIPALPPGAYHPNHVTGTSLSTASSGIGLMPQGISSPLELAPPAYG